MLPREQPKRVVISVDATSRKNDRHMCVIVRGFPLKPRATMILTPTYRDFVSLIVEESRRLSRP